MADTRKTRTKLDAFNSLACSLFVGGFLCPPLFVLSFLARSLVGYLCYLTPIAVGLRSFGDERIEDDLNEKVYRPASLRARVINLFNQTQFELGCRDLKKLGQEKPTPQAELFLGMGVPATVAAIILCDWLEQPVRLYGPDIFLDIGVIAVMSYYALYLEAARQLSHVSIYMVPYAASSLVFSQFGITIGLIVLIAVGFLIRSVLLHIVYKTASVVVDESDLHALAEELTDGPRLFGAAFLPVGFGVRTNIFCHGENWKDAVRLLLEHSDIAIIDLSGGPASSLRWEIDEVKEREMKVMYTCRKDSAHKAQRMYGVSKIDYEY